MANQQEIMDIVARVDANDRRLERLESLEFGTLAFPTGGANDWLCHEQKTLTEITDAITFSAIPQTHRHLVIIHEVAVFLVVGGFNIQEMRINGDAGANYDYFWQQFVAPATINFNDAAAAALMQVGSVPGRDAGAAQQNYYTAGHIWIPNYSVSLGNVFQSVVWDNFSYDGDDAGDTGSGNRMRELGGGYWRDAANITSLTFTCSGAQVFQTHSRWTLCLVCRIAPPE